MSAYRQNETKKGYNPFDYPEEWEFFKHPFEEEEEDDILTDLLFQIHKMERRLQLYFDNNGQLETAFYFGLLDSLAEADDYLLGALRYAKCCHLENLFFLTAQDELGSFLEKLTNLHEELLSRIRSFGDSTVELNHKCYEGNLFLREYCNLTQNGIPDDILRAILRAPGFPSKNEILKADNSTSIGSYLENLHLGLTLIEDDCDIEGACDSSGFEKLLQPVDMLLWHIRGTLLWVVIKKIRLVCSNADALGYRHNKLVETMCKNAYDEVCDVYTRSQTYAKRRDEEFLQQCGDYLYLQGRKPTTAEMHTYFNQQYRNLILTQNQSNQLYLRCHKQKGTFYIGFLNNLLNEETRQDAEDFLFCQTFSKELSTKHTSPKKSSIPKKFREFVKDKERTEEIISKLQRLIGNKTNTASLVIFKEAMWIELIDRPTLQSIIDEFHCITCSETYASRKLKEGEEKPKKGANVDEDRLNKIREKFRNA